MTLFAIFMLSRSCSQDFWWGRACHIGFFLVGAGGEVAGMKIFLHGHTQISEILWRGNSTWEVPGGWKSQSPHLCMSFLSLLCHGATTSYSYCAHVQC